MRAAVVVLTCVVTWFLSGCSGDDQTAKVPPLAADTSAESSIAASPTPSPTLLPEPKDLTCAKDLRVGTSGGLYPEGGEPEGFGSRREAVEAWIGDGSKFGLGTAYRMSDDGTSAWLLRNDGTAYASLPIREESGRFFTEGYTACDGLVD